MMRFAWMLGALTLIGCSSKDDGADSAGDGNSAVPGCGVESAISQYPASGGATDFYYRASVEFLFDGEDSDATITLMDAAGTDVDGTNAWNEDGNVLSFTPTVPLAASTDYTATLTHCKGSSDVGFRTSDLGGVLEEGPEGLIGKTYIVVLDGARFVKPAGIGSLLLDLLEQDILLGVVNADDTSLEMMGAISETETSNQDFCNESIVFPEAADFTQAPFFEIGPQDTTLSAAGFDVTIRQLRIAGDFSADYSKFGGGVLSGEIDARDIAPILVDNGLIDDSDPQTVCDLVAGFGVPCTPCESDEQPFCLSVYVDQINATSDDQVLEVLAECDPARCEGGCEE